ncbi:GHMP kinase, partial [Candidatus Bathyarchaeota archaeon]|nr:GHMP kinase [Candidatus Bathyarchaeota archaeon]
VVEEAKAFSPGHVTGFFQIMDQPNDPLLKGSRGAGVSISRGVTTKVTVEKSTRNSIRILTKNATNSALVSKRVANAFLSQIEQGYKVVVEHDVGVPIGCGFGSSGAGALSLALALNDVLSLELSRLETAQIAHVAEVECKTGLGTVIDEAFGGLQIRVRPGAPDIGEVKSIPVNGDHTVACLSLGPMHTPKILTSETFRQRINELGGALVDELVRQPSISNFMDFSRKFTEHVGLISNRLRKVLRETDSADIRCSMAMLGETVFSI